MEANGEKASPCHPPVHSLPQNTREWFIDPSCTKQRTTRTSGQGTFWRNWTHQDRLSELVLVTCVPPLLVARCHLLPWGHACGQHLSPEQAAASPFPLWHRRAQPEEPLQSPCRQQGAMVTQKPARSEMPTCSWTCYTNSKKANADSFTWHSKAFPTQFFTVSSETYNSSTTIMVVLWNP